MKVVFPPSVHAEVVGYVVKMVGRSKNGGEVACSDGKNRFSSEITERNVEYALGGRDGGEEEDMGAAVVHTSSEVVLRGSSHLAHQQQPQQRRSRANSRDFAAAV